jgi:hypothetical protein
LEKTKLGRLVDLVVDPVNGKPIYRYLLLLRGEMTNEKKDLLNCLMVAYSANLTKSHRTGVKDDDPSHVAAAKQQYQPAVIKNKVIAIFRFLKTNSVLYQASDFKSTKGSFHAYWKNKMMSVTAKARVNYGNLPNQPYIQANDNVHIWENASPPFFPFQNYSDFMMLLTYLVGRDFQLRTSEVTLSILCRLVRSIDFDHGTVLFSPPFFL